MKELIINADDFGFTRGANEGIVRAHRDGILTSATLMATGPAHEPLKFSIEDLMTWTRAAGFVKSVEFDIISDAFFFVFQPAKGQ